MGFVVSAILSILLLSCNQQVLGIAYGVPEIEGFVSQNEVERIASAIGPKMTLRSVNDIRGIESVLGNDDKPLFYVVNYEQGGFLIMSADNRIYPVLAFSKTGAFPLNENEYPSGLVDWMLDVMEYIEKVRSDDMLQTKEVAQSWELSNIQSIVTLSKVPPFDEPLDPVGPELPEDPCPSVYLKYGPLLSTLWGQKDGFNNLAPIMNCSNTANGRALAGCVATAMAQIMKYHEYPRRYDWNLMYDSTDCFETSRLMRDIGDAVGMQYSCGGSSADTKNRVPSAFKFFGYSSASYGEFDVNTVKLEIENNRPVILTGARKGGTWLFPKRVDGHAWVCDGYYSQTYYKEDCSSNWTFEYLHMNWGWDNQDELNAWYSSDWSPSAYDFNYKKGMVYNIIP